MLLAKSHTCHSSSYFPCSLNLLGPIFAVTYPTYPTCPEGLAGHAAAEQNEAAGVGTSASAGKAAKAWVCTEKIRWHFMLRTLQKTIIFIAV